MPTVTLKPGLLVSVRTRHQGGVKNDRVDLTADASVVSDKAEVSRWETTKIVDDVEEFDRASKVAGKCGSLIRAICAYSEFGYLCRADREAELDEAIADARRRAEEFNASAKTTRVSVFALKGRIAESDAEAAKAVSADLLALIEGMQTGVQTMNVKDIREAAAKAKKLVTMVDEATAKLVKDAVDEARDIATELRKKLDNGASGVAEATEYVQSVDLKALAGARAVFLDLEEPVGRAVAPAAAEGSEIDIDINDVGDVDASSAVDEDLAAAKVASSGESGEMVLNDA
jgi:hypothetical protein